MSNNKKQNNVISLEEREKLDYSKSNLTESGVKVLEFMEKKSTAWHIIMIILLFVIAGYLPILYRAILPKPTILIVSIIDVLNSILVCLLSVAIVMKATMILVYLIDKRRWYSIALYAYLIDDTKKANIVKVPLTQEEKEALHKKCERIKVVLVAFCVLMAFLVLKL